MMMVVAVVMALTRRLYNAFFRLHVYKFFIEKTNLRYRFPLNDFSNVGTTTYNHKNYPWIRHDSNDFELIGDADDDNDDDDDFYS